MNYFFLLELFLLLEVETFFFKLPDISPPGVLFTVANERQCYTFKPSPLFSFLHESIKIVVPSS